MEPSTNFSTIITRVGQLGPFADEAAAERALVATAQALTRFLTADEREQFSHALPSELRHIVPVTEGWATAKAGEFYLWAAIAEGVTVKQAVEHVQIACRALGECLPHDVVARLENLPAIGFLFSAASREPSADLVPARPLEHDLAEGHDGGRRPLADANPALLAHRHSVARNADPHSDTRLSSSRGLSQERENETLADGESGSRRKLSQSH
jgi:uncharacterized protein (DUF2267 family)